jgi:paraquat-inducible protein A
MPAGALVACHECDLLQREISLAPGGVARCGRCGALLYRSRSGDLDRPLAYILAAFVLFLISNTFPVVGLSVRGELIQATLLGAVVGIYEDGVWPIALLVLATTVIAPLVNIIAMAWLLLPMRLGRVPREFSHLFRVLDWVRPWGMVEVLMLGVLVALVKLARMAEVLPGIAMWAIAGEMLLLAAAASAFDPRALWSKAGQSP